MISIKFGFMISNLEKKYSPWGRIFSTKDLSFRIKGKYLIKSPKWGSRYWLYGAISFNMVSFCEFWSFKVMLLLVSCLLDVEREESPIRVGGAVIMEAEEVEEEEEEVKEEEEEEGRREEGGGGGGTSLVGEVEWKPLPLEEVAVEEEG